MLQTLLRTIVAPFIAGTAIAFAAAATPKEVVTYLVTNQVELLLFSKAAIVSVITVGFGLVTVTLTATLFCCQKEPRFTFSKNTKVSEVLIKSNVAFVAGLVVNSFIVPTTITFLLYWIWAVHLIVTATILVLGRDKYYL
jgi:hypothetical protein